LKGRWEEEGAGIRELDAREGAGYTSIHTGESGCAEGRGMFEALDLALGYGGVREAGFCEVGEWVVETF
tara:strand:- start:1560 stop:1766 length:207 start_codon:yes stop_codon:yes gene_type:complete